MRYRSLFAPPGTVTVTVAGVAGRTAHFMTVLGAVLFVSAATGSYRLAGAVSAGYALAYAAVSPVTSRLLDRFGALRVLVPAAVGTTCARVAMLVAVWSGAPGWVLVAFAALAGASMPALGPLARARWSRLYRGSPLLHPALSLESVIEETILIVAPIAVAVLAGYVDPAAGVVASVVLAAVGLAVLAVSVGSVGRPVPVGAGPPVRGLVPLMVTFVAVAAATVTIELAVVAFAQRRDAAAATGWILATMALSSALCGLWYGARGWRAPARDRLKWTLGLLAVGSLGFVAAPDVVSLFVVAALFGVTLAPAFIDGYAIAHDAVPAHRVTEGLTWMTTAVGIGIALGSALAGQALDAYGTTVTFSLATGFAVVGAGLAAWPAKRMAEVFTP